MRRRELLALVGIAAALPRSVRAQQPDRLRRIGVLNPFVEDDPVVQANIAAFRRTLQQLGWTDGRNARIQTAKALGLEIPPSLLARADEVIE